MAVEGVPVLVEGFVVEATCAELTRRGWVATPVPTTASRGVDIVATHGTVELWVEAKGAGSSRQGSSRYGKSFTASQVDTCVSKAALKALEAVTAGVAAAVAFPDNPDFRVKVQRSGAALRQLNVAIFWVAETGEVIIENEAALASRQ